MKRLICNPIFNSQYTASVSFIFLILLLVLTIGCDVNNYTDINDEELSEISVPEPFKANVYIESLIDLEEADYYIYLHVVDADQKIDSKIRVDFNQLKDHEFAFPRNRFGIYLRNGAFMYQVVETTDEFETLKYVHEEKRTAVIESLHYPFVYTDIGKFNYAKFFEDRGFLAPRLSAGDLFNPTEKDGILRSINF